MKIQCQMCDKTNDYKIDNRRVFNYKNNEFQFTCTNCLKEVYVVVSIS